MVVGGVACALRVGPGGAARECSMPHPRTARGGRRGGFFASVAVLVASGSVRGKGVCWGGRCARACAR
eukprot:4109095-Alexandrium_andersonii.AAC.1